MTREFYAAFRTTCFDLEWLTWCGSPMLYDGSLCVNRSAEDVEYHRPHKYKYYLEI